MKPRVVKVEHRVLVRITNVGNCSRAGRSEHIINCPTSSMCADPSSNVRTTSAISAVVDQGIALLQLLDRDLVATFLLRRGVRFAVVVRVLADPTTRRKINFS
jgi:hypothetical protein